MASEATAGLVRLGRALLLAVLVMWTWSFATAPTAAAAADSILHVPNLVFHEAGHVIFGIFGRFMGVLGGSLMQVLVPVMLAAAFLRRHDPFAAAVCVWWAGQNLVDLAPYIADARRLQLTLLGGRTGAEVEGHDWEYLLAAMGWLHLDVTIGAAVGLAGLIVMAVAIGWGVWLVARRRMGTDPI